jgi:hypothetical protein
MFAPRKRPRTKERPAIISSGWNFPFPVLSNHWKFKEAIACDAFNSRFRFDDDVDSVRRQFISLDPRCAVR